MDAQGTALATAPGTAPSVVAEIRNVFATAQQLHGAGHIAQAEQLYRTVLSIDPQHPDALHMLGVMANGNGLFETAVEFIREAIAIDGRHAEYHFNLGVSLQKLERLHDAASAYQAAITLKPGMCAAHENLGVALHELNDHSGALAAYQAACRLNPGSGIANANLGTLKLEHGDEVAARPHLERALEVEPLNFVVRQKLAWIDLWQGRMDDGWANYETRFCSADFSAINPPVNAPWPRWTGEPMPEGTLLVTTEQGVGDDILFASCMDELSELVQHVVIATDPRLVPLYQRSMRHATVISVSQSLQGYAIDRRISAGSLPALLRPSLEYFPRRRQFLWSDPTRTEHWRDRLGRDTGTLNVGISWRGGLAEKAQKARSIDLSAWDELLDTPGVRFFSVQYGDHAAEIDRCNAARTRVHTVDGLDCRDDIDDLAAFISALDLVITIDNATAHIAGALGVDTWLLRPKLVEWRWRPDALGNAWFPSVTQLNPDERGEWAPVMRECAQRLGAQRAPMAHPASLPLPRRAERVPPKRTGPLTDVALLNDTTHWYHFGCTATSLGIHRQLRACGHVAASVPLSTIAGITTLPNSLDDFDNDALFARFAAAHPDILSTLDSAETVYVNGEGTLHRLNQQPLALLYLMRIASHRLKKPVRVINHSCYPEGNANTAPDLATRIYRHVYSDLDHIAVREPVSAQLLRGMGLDVTQSFDCLPLYVEEQFERAPGADSPYIVIAGGVAWRNDTLPALAALVAHAQQRGLGVRVLTGSNAYPAADEPGFVRALSAACATPPALCIATSETQWLNEIANASLVVSSRFHHSIAAAFLDTPFLVSQSNTPKIGGLLDRLSMDALVALPATGDQADARRFRDELLDRSRLCLRDPQTHLLSPQVREQLLSLSRANFKDLA